MSTIAVKKVKLGDNADTSKNFLIEVPAVADGTLTIKRGDGADVLSIAADGSLVFHDLGSNQGVSSITPITIGDTQDLNNLSKLANRVYSGFNPLNGPAGYGGIYICEVICYSQDWLIQRFYAMPGGGNPAVYVRSWNNGSSWSSWVAL